MLARLLFFSLLNLISLSLPAANLKPTLEYEVDLIRLIWSVDEDDPVLSFVVERSEEGGYFTPLKEISAAYFNNPALDFRFEDKALKSGHAYRYRLRFRYANSHNLYSETIEAYFEKPDFVFHSLYAWPASLDHLGMDISVHQRCELKVSVLSPQGAVLYQDALILNYGEHKLEMNFPALAKGYYYLRLESETVIKIKAFVVQ